jgi:mevalonate kinase
MKENQLVGKIKAYLRTVEGLFFWKEHGGQYGTAGIPDVIVCYRGRFIAFECKTASGKPTVLQEVTIGRIRKAGGTAEVVRSVDEVKALINKTE